eukprot:201496-Rhodomonas_salina.1
MVRALCHGSVDPLVAGPKSRGRRRFAWSPWTRLRGMHVRLAVVDRRPELPCCFPLLLFATAFLKPSECSPSKVIAVKQSTGTGVNAG